MTCQKDDDDERKHKEKERERETEYTLDNKASKITQRMLKACSITIEVKTKRLKVDPLKRI